MCIRDRPHSVSSIDVIQRIKGSLVEVYVFNHISHMNSSTGFKLGPRPAANRLGPAKTCDVSVELADDDPPQVINKILSKKPQKPSIMVTKQVTKPTAKKSSSKLKKAPDSISSKANSTSSIFTTSIRSTPSKINTQPKPVANSKKVKGSIRGRGSFSKGRGSLPNLPQMHGICEIGRNEGIRMYRRVEEKRVVIDFKDVSPYKFDINKLVNKKAKVIQLSSDLVKRK
eukprot:TRINITY_DN623_c0_g2_i2.p1 TRINITY_DN623_c0_g2~~TRINITY_DN623_c0_g2_i2.p1  ORF type:complete len:228 (+),score=36.74 TRINITY_DN623_c0_g2_i2:74-757(+)